MTTTQTPQERAGYVWCSSCQRYEHPNWHGPRVATVEQTARERGEQAGRDHASWIETDSDVEMPACLSGEWAGESITELIGDLLDEVSEDDNDAICDAYEEGFAQGWNAVVHPS